MDDAVLSELAGWYEEFLHADRDLASTKQAKALFEHGIKKLYLALSESYRAQVTIEQYRSVLIPEVDAYLNKRQTIFPTITPERTDNRE